MSVETMQQPPRLDRAAAWSGKLVLAGRVLLGCIIATLLVGMATGSRSATWADLETALTRGGVRSVTIVGYGPPPGWAVLLGLVLGGMTR